MTLKCNSLLLEIRFKNGLYTNTEKKYKFSKIHIKTVYKIKCLCDTVAVYCQLKEKCTA